jgi:hypothetical protein
LKVRQEKFIWRDKSFDEPWWISLGAVSDDVVLFTVYLETNNPDKKGVFAYHIRDDRMLWWHNDFSLVSVSTEPLKEFRRNMDSKKLSLIILNGQETTWLREQGFSADAIRPHQYLPDHAYFDTVKTFLEQKFNLSPVVALEYLEYDSIVFISFYVQENELATICL